MKQIILMADIIKSRTHNQKELMSHFQESVVAVNKNFRESLLSPVTITLGDEFQCVVKDLASAIKMVLFLEEELIHSQKHFKLRYVINEGEIETEINPNIAFGMLGEGLTKARYMLSKLKNEGHRFFLFLENQVLSELINQSFIILESIVDKWRETKDYELVSHFLKYKDYKNIAILLSKTRSQIWKREKSLNLESYYAIKNIIESTSKLTI
jgi:SatD family (SatD)